MLKVARVRLRTAAGSNPSQRAKVSMSPKKRTQKSAESATAIGKQESKGFTDEERAAMKERAQEADPSRENAADHALTWRCSSRAL